MYKALFSNAFLSKGGERHTCTIGIFEKDAFLHRRPRNERPDRVEFRVLSLEYGAWRRSTSAPDSSGARCLYVTSFWEKINNHPPRLIPTHTLSLTPHSHHPFIPIPRIPRASSPFTPFQRRGWEHGSTLRLCATTRCLRNSEDEASGFSTRIYSCSPTPRRSFPSALKQAFLQL